MKYFDELKRSMEMLALDPNVMFLGQAVEYKGTAMYNTLRDIDESKRLELPVCEDLQMGMTNGLALTGKIPVSIFPRWNFLLLGTNQIVNHLDKIPYISNFKTKAIIRTSIGSVRPLHPQDQHTGDYTQAFENMCSTIDIIRLNEPEDVFPAYTHALNREDGKSTILVEWGDYYGEK